MTKEDREKYVALCMRSLGYRLEFFETAPP